MKIKSVPILAILYSLIYLSPPCILYGEETKGFKTIKNLSLKDLEALALNQSDEIRLSHERNKKIDLEKERFFGSLLPKIDMSMGLSSAKLQSSDSLNKSADIQIKAIVPNPIKIQNTQRNIENMEEFATADVKLQEIQVITKIRKNFLKILHLRHKISVTDDNLELLGRIKKENEKRFSSGFINKMDFKKSQMQYQTTRTEREILSLRLRAEKKTLSHLIHDQAEISLLGSLKYEDQKGLLQWKIKELEELVAKNENRDIKIKKVELKSKDVAIAAAKNKYFPEVSLGASFPVYREDEKKSSYHAGLSWNLFNGGLTSAEVREKSLDKSLLEMSLQYEDEQLKIQLQQSVTALHILKESISLQHESVKNWESIIKTSQLRFEGGHISYRELNEDISSFIKQKVLELDQIFQMLDLLVDFTAKTGYPEEFYRYFKVS